MEKDTFYKYVTLEAVKDILINNHLRFAKPSQFNDLYEFQLPYFQSNEIEINQQEIQEKLYKHKYENTKVLCLTERYNNLPLWAHYAEMHQGCALGFKVNSEDSLFKSAKKVNYVDKTKENIIIEPNFLPQDIGNVIVNKTFFTKDLQWSYEEEWRICDVRNLNDSSDYILQKFNPNDLVCIVLGIQFPLEQYNCIINLLNEKYPKCKRFKLEFDNRNICIKKV